MKGRGGTAALVLGLLSLPFAVFAPLAILSAVRSLRRGPSISAAAGLVAAILSLLTLLVVGLYWVLATP